MLQLMGAPLAASRPAATVPTAVDPASAGAGSVTTSVLLIVVVVSLLVALLIKGLTALLGRTGAAAPAPAARPVPARAPAPGAAAPGAGAGATTSAGHDPRHVAAISAAVSSVFDDAAVVVHIEPVRGVGVGWAAEGRAAHHTSHNVGRTHR